MMKITIIKNSNHFFIKYLSTITLIIAFLTLHLPQSFAIIEADREVIPGEAQYVGLIEQWENYEGWYGICTGTLVAPRIVLTAAHCVSDVSEESWLRINFPTHSTKLIDAKPINITGFIYHFKYDEQQSYDLIDLETNEVLESVVGYVPPGDSEYDDDIALLYLEEAVSDIKYPKLAGNSTKILPNWRVYGWGLTSSDSSTLLSSSSNTLNTTSVKDATVEMVELLEDPMDNMLGAYQLNSFGSIQTTCYGDSGGPLVDGKGVVIGITSFSMAESCEEVTPTVYTKVAKYRSWIYRATARLKGSVYRSQLISLPIDVGSYHLPPNFKKPNKMVVLTIR